MKPGPAKRRFRQVHLDFHTSEHIPAVGARFDERQFQKALRAGHVDSITLFAKCHHSWSYYPTKVGKVHPQLRTDLLGRMIAAAQAIGVRTPIYYTVGWSSNDAENHPEWVVRTQDGRIEPTSYDLKAKSTDPRPIVSWKFLEPSGGYKDLILAQTREICREYPVDGFFYDICNGPVSMTPDRLRVMREAGLDPARPADVAEFRVRVWTEFMTEARAAILEMHPDATVFFNGVSGVDSDPRYHAMHTHFELEDLPTFWGGYDKFPLRAKFFSTLGKPLTAMSGKFHTMWGEFGGYKHPDAITAEAAAMVAWGAACSFGDQLHPSGEMDIQTYENIGKAYRHVKVIEPFTAGATPWSNLGVILTGGIAVANEHGVAAATHDQGVVNLLLESQADFEITTTEGDWAKFQTLILTGNSILDSNGARRIRDYLTGGGSLLMLGESALLKSTGKLAIDIGARYLGKARFVNDYTLAKERRDTELPTSPFLNYSAGLRIRPRDGDVLAEVYEPYFDRTYGKYCSHQNTPYQLKPSGFAAAIRKERVVFAAHSLGSMYLEYGARVHKDLFRSLLDLVHTRPTLRVKMPSAARVNLLKQPSHNRYVAHLLYAPPLQRGKCSVIEDLVALRDISVSLRIPERVRKVWLPLTGQPLTLTYSRGVARTTLPVVQNHAAVVFEY